MALEAVLFFLVFPAAASVVCLVAVRSVIAAAPTGVLMGTDRVSRNRFVMFAAILTTPVVFGLVLWFLDLSVADAIGSQSSPEIALYDRLRTWSGIVFAWSATVTVATESFVVVRRWRQYAGAEFGRVQPLVVIPELAALFALILAFFIFGAIQDALAGGSVVTDAAVNEVVSRLLVFCLGVVAIPVGLSASNRVMDLRGRGFLQALLRAESGVVVLLLAFAWAYLSVAGLRS